MESISSHLYLQLFYFVTLSAALSSVNMAARSMTRGVGVYRTLKAKNAASVAPLVEYSTAHFQSSRASCGIKRCTAVAVGTRVVLVEEWESKQAYDDGQKEASARPKPVEFPKDLVSSLTTEYFPEALHISNPIDSPNTETVGILVRQKTSSTENGGKLRDAQREAYERQMTKEPGCTCCIILAGGEDDDTQVRIVELWRTMQDFHFHESSDWHALGEEKVVPLVVDMDCDFVKGWQLVQNG